MFESLDLPTVLTFFIFLLFTFLIWEHMSRKKVDIPGPSSWPVLGNLPGLITSKNLSETYLELAKKYGNLVRLRFGRAVVVVVCGYKNVNEVLVTNADKTKFRPSGGTIKRIFPNGGGLVISNGQRWSDIRRFTIVALKDFGVGKKTIEQRIHEETECLIDSLTKQNKSPVDVSQKFSKATANIISNIIFGSRFEYDDPEFTHLIEVITRIFKLTIGFSVVSILPFLYYILPSNMDAQRKQCRDEIQAYISKRIDQQRESFDPKNLRSFLDLYLEQEGKPDSKISEDCLFLTIADLYFAGTDTTSMSLQWCMLYMLKYPEVQKRCREEILEVIGDGRLPTVKDRDNLPYVMATLNEVQRIATIVPNSVPHYTSDDIEVDGKVIPKGTSLTISLLSVHKDPTIWKDPEVFYPGRFLDNEGKLVKRQGFMAFSAGPRLCVGRQLAESELLLFFVSILQRFDLEKANVNDVLDTHGLQTGTTYQPKPFKLRFIPK